MSFLREIKEAYYRVKCWVTRPYTTIHPRGLPHTYVDAVELLPHVMFEVLCRFMEKEKPGDHIDWGADEAHSQAWATIQTLYTWWTQTLPRKKALLEKRWEEVPDWRLKPTVEGYSRLVYVSDEEEELARTLTKSISEDEEALNQELIQKMCDLVKVKDFLWT